MTDPIKPHNAATYFVREYERLLDFLPEKSRYRKLIEQNKQLVCENHVVQGPKTMGPGQKVVAVKYPTGGSKGKATYTVKFYCSIACQRNHAVALKADRVYA
ncbi:MAG: hypothetical protein Q7R71_01910 [bacterium]|nr:hypothetical protein [bacterium]